jgi:glyoxylase-like metal-dependent hydrolase (beta-lactamase superfamily II)
MGHDIEAFYDDRTSTLTYVVSDPDTRDAVVIDPVLDYEPKASETWTESVDEVIEFVDEHDLDLHYVLETHAHADHLSGSQIIKERHPDVEVVIGEKITEVQALFKDIFDLPEDFPTDGRQFDRLVAEGETIEAGSLSFEVIETPGHTPACVTYEIDDAIFTGDALFMPDMGTGRCDFPGGSAEDMYHSVHDKLYELPDDTKVYVGHDYQPGGRDVEYCATLGEHKRNNVKLTEDMTLEAFVEARESRDAELEAPQLLFQSVQVNVDAGKLPEPSDNEIRYMRIPINVFRPDEEDEGDVTLEEV